MPNNTFKANAGTEVTSDIIFLQKRDTLVTEEPDWVHLDRDENGNEYNKYFVDHPEMVLGEMVMDRLRDADEVSYVRFASVYREFKDVNTFMSEIKKILDK